MEYKITSDGTFSDDDCTVVIELTNVYPVLTLTDEFVNDVSVNSVDVDVGTSKNKLYLLDSDGNDILVHIGTFKSLNKNDNSIYFDPTTKQMFTVFALSDIDNAIMKNSIITVAGLEYSSVVSLKPNRVKMDSLSINYTGKVIGIPTPTTLENTTQSRVTLDVPSMSFPMLDISNIGSMSNTSPTVVLDLIAINASDIGWDDAEPIVSTMLRAVPYNKNIMYIGKVNADTFYLPIL